MKIAVLGYSGAGKSTLARALASALDIPCLHLDQVHWLPGWTERAREESRQMVKDFLDQNSSWVIDGNYKSFCYEQRLEQADHIVFLNFPRLRCLWRAWRRSIRYRDRHPGGHGRGLCGEIRLGVYPLDLVGGPEKAPGSQPLWS